MSYTPVFRAEVVDGKLKLANRAAFDAYVQKQAGPVEVVVRKVKSKRTLDQNAYYWVLIGIIAAESEEDRTYVHKWVKRQFNWEPVDKLGRPVCDVCGLIMASTRILTTKEFSELIDRLKLWMLENGLRVPEPWEVEL